MRHWTWRIAPAAAVLLLAGCGGGTTAPAAACGSAVSVTPTSATVAVGASVQFTAVLRITEGCTHVGSAVTWSSGNSAVATVSATGIVTGVTPGSATITAAMEGNASGSAQVTVTAAP